MFVVLCIKLLKLYLQITFKQVHVQSCEYESIQKLYIQEHVVMQVLTAGLHLSVRSV